MKTKSKAPALERGLNILKYIAGSAKTVSFNEIVKANAIPPASAARLLNVLIHNKFLKKTPESYYILGESISLFSQKESMNQKIHRLSTPYLRSLSQQTQQTCLVFYWDSQAWICSSKIMNENSLAMQSIGEVRTDILNYPWSSFLVPELSESHLAMELKHFHEPKSKQQALQNHYHAFQKHHYHFEKSSILYRFTAPLFNKKQFIGAIALGKHSASMNQKTIHSIGNKIAEYAKLITKEISKN